MLRILAADMGGTTCRFGFFEAAHGGELRLIEIIRLQTRAFDSFAALLEGLFASSSAASASGPPFGPRACDACVLAVPGAVVGGAYCKPPNIPWDIDLAEAARRGLSRALLINDFAAQAWACRSGAGQAARVLQPGRPDPAGVVAVIGAGTGLGHCALAGLEQGGFLILPSEAGHAAFPFVGPEEAEYGEFLRRRTGAAYCVGDSVVTGSGLAHLFEYLTGDPATPAEAAGRLGEYPRVTEWFARFYGRAARNYALAVLARGGLFVSGGVAARNPALVDHPAFLEELRSSRGHARLLADMPVAHMADQDAGVHGAALAALHLVAGRA